MIINLQTSVVKITSSKAATDNFGTGFIIYKDIKFTYLLTCAHVIEDIGGGEWVQVEGSNATIVAIGVSKGLDLAVLCVEKLLDGNPLDLFVTGKKGDLITIIGFQAFDQKYFYKLTPIQGYLGEQGVLESKLYKERIRTWDLLTKDDNYIEPGYSGSPVIAANTNKVLGIVSYRLGKGDKGLAISIEALCQLWQDMPSTLLKKESFTSSSISQQYIYLSSALHQMPAHLQKILDACQRQRIIPILSNDDATIVENLERLNHADFYLGVFAHHYGSVNLKDAGRADLSLIEFEYNHAVERNIPRVIFR